MKLTIEINTFKDLINFAEYFLDKQNLDNHEDLLPKPLKDFHFSIRVTNVLASEKIETIGDLCQLSEKNLMRIGNIGKISIRQIKKVLEEHGLSLASKFNEEFAKNPNQFIKQGEEL